MDKVGQSVSTLKKLLLEHDESERKMTKKENLQMLDACSQVKR